MVDSSGWLEYLADGPNADFFAKPITATADLVVPTVSLYEGVRRGTARRAPTFRRHEEEGKIADKANERLKEQIKYEMEVLKFIALVMVALGGGAVSLFLGTPTVLRFGLAGLGFLATLTLGVVSWRLDRRIRMLIAQIEVV